MLTPTGSAPDPDGSRPELADVGRLARRLVRRVVRAARTEEAPLQVLLRDHLGPGAAQFPVVSSSWPAYDQVNVQFGVEAWLAQPGRESDLTGLTGYRHMDFGLADLLGPSRGWHYDVGVGNVQMSAQASGPGGQTHPCVQCGIYLVDEPDGSPRAVLLRGPDERGPSEKVTVQVCAPDEAAAQRVMDELRRSAVERNVFRGHVITFGGEVFGDGRSLLSFQDRPHIDRSQVVLPGPVLDGIERHVLGVAEHARRLTAAGQHLKRGLLLYGAPGTGKTHTIRYLLGRLPSFTVIILSGGSLGYIGEACSVARTLQPALIVVEDVDLIAEERTHFKGKSPLLFELLNEMDGLGADVDVTFLLTTNRADLLEEALAARPGRVDHAAELPLPDAAARQQLIGLYRGGLALDLTDPDAPVRRTEGVTASFLKELLRRAALLAAERSAATPEDAAAPEDEAAAGAGAAGAEPLRVTNADMAGALDQLLDVRNQLTQTLLGGVRKAAEPAG
jgi:hypothetical protein